MTTNAPDSRRATVRQLADEGLSNRAIARHVGVSEATVRRWRSAAAPTLTIPFDDDIAADLAIMARAGLDPYRAIRCALGIVAGTYANAWSAGVIPDGEQPVLVDCAVRRWGEQPGETPAAPPAPMEGSET